MVSLDLNTPISYLIRGFEYVSPQIRDLAKTVQDDATPVLKAFNETGSADARAISNLVLHVMQPIKYLFWSSALATCANYLVAKNTPIFSSIFKVTTFISAFFTFDLFVTFALTYKEYYYFEWRGKEHNPNVAWDDYIKHVDDYSRGILSSTFLLSSSRFLSEDVNGGLVKIMETAKAADGVISIQEVNKYLPAISTWFNLKAREE